MNSIHFYCLSKLLFLHFFNNHFWCGSQLTTHSCFRNFHIYIVTYIQVINVINITPVCLCQPLFTPQHNIFQLDVQCLAQKHPVGSLHSLNRSKWLKWLLRGHKSIHLTPTSKPPKPSAYSAISLLASTRTPLHQTMR